VNPLKVGDVLDAYDKTGKWYESIVVDIDESNAQIKVHYNGW
jgi:hypothetical protein